MEDDLLKKIVANYVLYISAEVDGNLYRRSYSFYLDRDISVICEKLKSAFSFEKSKNKIRAVIILKNVSSRGFTLYLDKPEEGGFDEIFSRAKGVLRGLGVVDIKSTRYRVVIRNAISSSYDNRSFCFNSEKGFEEVVEELKALLHKIITREREGNVVFDAFNLQKKATHYIIVFDTYVRFSRSKSKSFRISIPGYSSSEILDLIVSRDKKVVEQ
jgi:hypothetical protein